MRNPGHPAVAKIASHVGDALAAVDDVPTASAYDREALRGALATALNAVNNIELEESK
ncbi:MAG: hypothetical protein WBW80_23105 [Acidimicrobiales bacterium]